MVLGDIGWVWVYGWWMGMGVWYGCMVLDIEITRCYTCIDVYFSECLTNWIPYCLHTVSIFISRLRTNNFHTLHKNMFRISYKCPSFVVITVIITVRNDDVLMSPKQYL